MRFARPLTVIVLLGAALGLPMCGSEDPKKQVGADGGEGGEPAAGSPASGGSTVLPTAGGQDGSAEPEAGGQGGGVPEPPSGAGQGGQSPGVAGTGGTGSEAGASGAGGETPFCAVDEVGCCDPGEPSCDDWPGQCGQDMNSYSCCEAGVRQRCSVEYYDANYHLLFGRDDCACSAGSCDCQCIKADACGSQEADCNSTSWHDICVLGNSPTCCDSANGIRQNCAYNGGKVFTSEPIIDACTGEGFGNGGCDSCVDGQEPLCDQDFFAGCSDALSHCSDPTIGYRMSCQDGVSNVVCTCDPNVIVNAN